MFCPVFPVPIRGNRQRHLLDTYMPDEQYRHDDDDDVTYSPSESHG